MGKSLIGMLFILFSMMAGFTGCDTKRGQDHLDQTDLPAQPRLTERVDSSQIEPSPEENEHGPFILMLDDFSDAASGWENRSDTHGRVGYADGGYIVEALIPNEPNRGRAGKDYTDVRIEVDVKALETNEKRNDAFGVDCRVQANGDGYGFRISSDGFFSIEMTIGQERLYLVQRDFSDVLYRDGQMNHITAICQGDHFSLLVNDENIAEAIDDTLTAGDLALAAESFEDEPISVLFDDIVVQEIGNPYEYEDAE